jgi:hypothetical protein
VLVVTALLAVVAFAAHGRPLGTGGGTSSGLPRTFWDFAFTSLVIAELLMLIVGLVTYVYFRREVHKPRKSYESRTFRALATLVLLALLVTYIGRHIDLNHLLHPNGTTTATTATGTTSATTGGKQPAQQQHVHFRWEELVVVLAVLLGLGVAAVVTRRRLPAATRRDGAAPDLLAAALDESLDDLRSDPDLRRAIVAAYARMEQALAAAGLPRDPAEAPLEFMERALLSLDTSAAAVRRLTDLFEWARFSHHEPEPSMRDEAVDALVAVRDELRAPDWVVT